MKNIEKLRIYDLLMTNYQVGDCVPMSAVGNFLRAHGVTAEIYGYPKLLGLFQELSELCVLESYLPHPNAPAVWKVTFLARPDLEVESEEDSELPNALNEDVLFFHYDRQNDLARYITGQECRLSADALAQIRKDYIAAKAKGQVVFDEVHNCYSFGLSTPAANGSALMISLRKNDRGEGLPWFVHFVGYDDNKSVAPKKTSHAKNALREFAYLGDQTEFLRSLAEHVQEENWNFSGKDDDYHILHQYITYTFYCAQKQEKVSTAPDGSFAVFNTGLQSRVLGEDVYAYFVPNVAGSESPWKFYCFCSAGSGDTNERRCYAQMLSAFEEPEPPQYFNIISDLLFDPACSVSLSSDHIFRDNCDRLPVDFLRREFAYWGNREALDLLGKIEGATKTEKRELYQQLGDVIVGDHSLFVSMNGRLQNALDATIKRIRRNYKLAVPCYFPSRGVMSMMLPISFDNREAPNLVLVCERTPHGVYLGQTVLTLSMAYINARLICRPGSEWLNTQNIINDENGESADIVE